MIVAEMRSELQMARVRLIAGDAATAIHKIEKVLGELAPERLVTTSDATRLLGVRSEFIVRLLCREGVLKCRHDGDCTLVSLEEIDRMMDSPEVREIRELDRLHDASEAFSAPDGLTEEELADLSASQPGTLPWQR